MADKPKVVRWVKEPPPDGRGERSTRPGAYSTNGSKEFGFWNELRSRPREWAEIPVSYTGASIHKETHPDFEIVSRTLRNGRKAVFARYLG
jgi:hypothetical protein